MNDEMPRFPWGAFVALIILCGLTYWSCEAERKREEADPLIRSECRDGFVWYKWRTTPYWTMSGTDEGKQPTKCSN